MRAGLQGANSKGGAFYTLHALLLEPFGPIFVGYIAK